MNTMSKAQSDFIVHLADEKDLSLEWDGVPSSPSYFSAKAREALDNLRSLWQEGRANKMRASAVISMLKDAPAKAGPRAGDPEAGVYFSEESGEYLRVYLGQESGHMLAKQVHLEDGEVSYTYLGAARRYLTPDYRRCTLEEAGSLGKASGICIHCGRLLTDPESVDRGIGPICADKY